MAARNVANHTANSILKLLFIIEEPVHVLPVQEDWHAQFQRALRPPGAAWWRGGAWLPEVWQTTPVPQILFQKSFLL
jgi:hypothetical protein